MLYLKRMILLAGVVGVLTGCSDATGPGQDKTPVTRGGPDSATELRLR
jgi:hypothetical protein